MKNNFLSRPVAPATYLGFQEGLPAYGNRPALPGIELWNLTAPFGEYPEGSTISKKTIHEAGYMTPAEAEAVKNTGIPL